MRQVAGGLLNCGGKRRCGEDSDENRRRPGSRVRGIPGDYSVEMLDYDIDGRELHELEEDEDHRMCRISEGRAGNGA